MRRTVKRKVDNNRDRLYTIFAFFVVAPIISIVLAFVLVQNVILPRLDNGQNVISTIDNNLDNELESDLDSRSSQLTDNENISNEDSMEEQSTYTEVSQTEDENTVGSTFYSVQVGNFSSITNAELLVKELKSNNIEDSYIVDLGDSYKVFAGEFQSKDEAYNYLEIIRKLYEDAFVNVVSSKDKILKP